MKDIQHYKDEVAKENGYDYWLDLLEGYRHKTITKLQLDLFESKWAKRYGADLCKSQKKLCADALDIGYEDNLHKQQILNARLATDN